MMAMIQSDYQVARTHVEERAALGRTLEDEATLAVSLRE
jgi:hypothetical protein